MLKDNLIKIADCYLKIKLKARSAKRRLCIGSLTPTFVPVWLVSRTVKLAFAFTLSIRFPSEPSQPLNASVTLWEATAPVKLPARHGPGARNYRSISNEQFTISHKLAIYD